MSRRVVVLDAMGVMYQAQDDVAEILVPFIRQHRPSVAAEDVAVRYREASLGQLDPDAFWRTFDLEPSVEDDYLSLHRLAEGLLDFLALARASSIEVWCLSNDVSRWSRKLRHRFALEHLFAGFVISADIGHRKPAAQAYRCLIDRIGTVPDVFVDDRPRNVIAAQGLGIRSLCFGWAATEANGVSNFAELAQVVAGPTLA